MRLALATHDAVLRDAIEGHDGWLFKHTGDGVCAAFSAAGDAVAAAVDAQLGLGLPVRMGIGTGTAELRGDDYFGPALNRAARVMAAGHGGQILVANSTAALVAGVGLVDLGERRLRDLSGAEHLFQVRAAGLPATFPPLRTLDAVPGNLAVQSTSFVGREVEVKELCELVRAHRLVTLTGVGGVGKTRLAVQVAAELTGEFGDGVWLVELAPVGDPAAVPDVVATVLGVTAQAGVSVTAAVTQALSGRRLLVVLDNCEHVIDAAADLVEAILAGTSTVQVLATSREGLRVGAEHLWPVPSLDVGGDASAAVELFVERARAANPAFALLTDADSDAVSEICSRLDGIALAIELAAARMVSMTAQDVRDRLDDRFRLLAGARRGLERHQTLRHAVGWSFELLDADERAVLCRCSVFAGGFDLPAAVSLQDGLDEYTVLDVLDSLVRKSLVTINQTSGHARYGMLETIRQYAEDQLAANDAISDVRDRHAAFYAAQAQTWWDRWDGPGYDAATEWVDAEFANLRAGFRWTTDRNDLVTATAIAAHSTMLSNALQRYEPVGWAEEILDAATTAQVPQLPRLYTAASVCTNIGRAEEAVGYAETATRLEPDPRYDPFEAGWTHYREANAHMYAGRFERAVELAAALAAQPGTAGLHGQCILPLFLSIVGRQAEAMAIAEDTVTAARRHANPWFVAYALHGYGRAFTQDDPTRTLHAYREGLDYTTTHRVPIFQAVFAANLAGLEAVHGTREHALDLFDTALDSFHQAGNKPQLAVTLAHLAVFFDHDEQPQVAATLYGATTHDQTAATVVGDLPVVVAHLRAVLGDTAFNQHTASGAAMEPGDVVAYAHHQIRTTRTASTAPS